MLPRTLLLLSALLGASTGACQGQVTPDYKGEAVATIRGSVVASADSARAADEALDAALMWTRYTFSGESSYTNPPIDQRLLTKAAVTGAFPATFTLQVFTTPPDEALVSCYPAGDPRVGRMAFGDIVVVDAGTTVIDARTPAALRGVATGYHIAYLDHDVEPTSTCGSLTGVTTAGYHLLQMKENEAGRKAARVAFELCVRKADCERRVPNSDAGSLSERVELCKVDFVAAHQLIAAPGGLDTFVTIEMLNPAPDPAPATTVLPPPDAPQLPPSTPSDGGSSSGCP